MIRKRLRSILVKPAGPDCNLGCTYCFYRGKGELFPDASRHRMSPEILEETLRQLLDDGPREVSVCWQGGEPTLMGLPFFEQAIEFEKRYGEGKTVGNSLQTNGVLIDRPWARFLRRHRFLVGLSIDGPEHVHDRYRHDRSGRGSWQRACDAAKHILDAGIAVNALSVVNDYSSRFADEIYEFHKDLGLGYMQFIPCLERATDRPGSPTTFSVKPTAYGAFLCQVFDRWLADFSDGRPTTSVRLFESLLCSLTGMRAPECALRPECGTYLVVEHNGDVYACDFYVEPQWKIGNVTGDHLATMLNSPRQVEFGRRKADRAETCSNCEWIDLCHGGCPRNRLDSSNSASPSYLCEAYDMFFRHAMTPLRRLAEQRRHPAAAVRA